MLLCLDVNILIQYKCHWCFMQFVNKNLNFCVLCRYWMTAHTRGALLLDLLAYDNNLICYCSFFFVKPDRFHFSVTVRFRQHIWCCHIFSWELFWHISHKTCVGKICFNLWLSLSRTHQTCHSCGFESNSEWTPNVSIWGHFYHMTNCGK